MHTTNWENDPPSNPTQGFASKSKKPKVSPVNSQPTDLTPDTPAGTIRNWYRMNRIILLALTLAFLSGSAHARVIRNGDCTVDSELLQLPACALETHNGRLYVSKAYLQLFFASTATTDEMDTPGILASTYLPEGDWAYVNRAGLIVVRNVAVMDNGANEFHHGLVRVTKDNKWGLADIRGRMIVPLTYDGMLDYQADSGWLACTGCRNVKQGEYAYFQGGSWVRLDRRGKVRSPAEPPLPARNPKQQD